MANIGHPPPKLRFSSWQDGVFELSRSIRSILRGETNNVGTLTLTNGATSTTVTDARVHANSVIALIPTSANAASLDALSWWISAKNDGSFVVSHGTDVPANSTFDYLLQG